MSHVGPKGFRASGALCAERLTAGCEDVPGILPPAKKGELKKVREASNRLNYLNPAAWETANNKMMRHYLVMAANRIAELERKLAEMFGGKR